MSTYIKEKPEYLQLSLESIWTNQIRKPDEIVLVEDGQLTNELHDVIAAWKQSLGDAFVVVVNEKNLGLALSLNNGMKHAKGDVIIRMDSDDIAFPERIDIEAAFLEEHPDIDVVGAWIDEFIDSPENVISTRKVPETSKEIYAFGRSRNPMNHPSVAFRKDTVLRYNGYKHFLLFEDYCLWATLLKNGCSFYNIQRSLLWFRSSLDMFSRRGGLSYALTEVRFQYYMYKIRYISLVDMLCNIPVRFIARIMPNSLRSYIYKKAMR